ncbi:ATP-binding cassette domain-containing protein [Gordonia humi]|uniref:ATP-binding cassette domain-containing protein n=1 Tax=Gordonia humi TaxID=686429 RepID=UPI0036240F29
MTAAALFFHRLFAPIGSLLSSIDDLQRAAAGLGRLVGVLLVDPDSAIRREVADAGISIRSLTYRYRPDADDVLDEISVDVPAGGTAVLVGASGSGKSTLAQLIAGVLVPRSGEVLIGGVPAAEAWCGDRRAVLLVTQDTHLFAGTLADNLRLADPDASDTDLWSALDTVEADWAHRLEGAWTPSSGTTSMMLAFNSSPWPACCWRIRRSWCSTRRPHTVAWTELWTGPWTRWSGGGPRSSSPTASHTRRRLIASS